MASKPLSIIVLSGSRERLQMAAMLAAVSSVSGNPVKVFVSMNALQFFVKGSTHRAEPEGAFGRLLQEKNAPEWKTLFEQAVTLGDAKIVPCSMAMDLLGLEADGLEPYLGEPTGLTRFLDDSEDAELVSF